MSRLLVIGASRGIGLETVKAALEAGHEVRAFARGAKRIALEHPKLEKINGDALVADDIRAGLDGVDVVVQVLGAPINPETLLTGTRLFSEATRILVDAMEANGPKRLICVTGLGAGDSRGRLGAMFSLVFTLSIARIYDDKDVQERHWNHDDLVRIAGAGLAALALVLAAIGFVRREDHRPVIVGAGLGGGAIAFGFVTWLALVAAGLVIIWIVVANLGGILGAGGLGGGVRAFYRYRPPSHAVSAP